MLILDDELKGGRECEHVRVRFRVCVGFAACVQVNVQVSPLGWKMKRRSFYTGPFLTARMHSIC